MIVATLFAPAAPRAAWEVSDAAKRIEVMREEFIDAKDHIGYFTPQQNKETMNKQICGLFVTVLILIAAVQIPGSEVYVATRASNAVIEACDSLEAVFTASVDGLNTNITYYYEWDFNSDGTKEMKGVDKQIVTNTFGPGIYAVSLTVSNSQGEVTNLVKTSHIKVVPSTTYVSQNGSGTWPYST